MSLIYEIIPDKIPKEQLERMRAFVKWATETGCMVKQEPSKSPKVASKDKTLPNTLMVEVGALFGRRANTHWSKKEVDAFKLLKGITSDDIRSVARYYEAMRKTPNEDYRRTSLQTLLNNWNGELDRARNYKYTTTQNQKEGEKYPEPSGWIEYYARKLGHDEFCQDWFKVSIETKKDIIAEMS